MDKIKAAVLKYAKHYQDLVKKHAEGKAKQDDHLTLSAYRNDVIQACKNAFVPDWASHLDRALSEPIGSFVNMPSDQACVIETNTLAWWRAALAWHVATNKEQEQVFCDELMAKAKHLKETLLHSCDTTFPYSPEESN